MSNGNVHSVRSREASIGIRDRGKKLLEQGKRQAKRARSTLGKQADRSRALQKTMECVGIAGKWTLEKLGEAQQAVEQKMRQHMGFDEY